MSVQESQVSIVKSQFSPLFKQLEKEVFCKRHQITDLSVCTEKGCQDKGIICFHCALEFHSFHIDKILPLNTFLELITEQFNKESKATILQNQLKAKEIYKTLEKCVIDFNKQYYELMQQFQHELRSNCQKNYNQIKRLNSETKSYINQIQESKDHEQLNNNIRRLVDLIEINENLGKNEIVFLQNYDMIKSFQKDEIHLNELQNQITLYLSQNLIQLNQKIQEFQNKQSAKQEIFQEVFVQQHLENIVLTDFQLDQMSERNSTNQINQFENKLKNYSFIKSLYPSSQNQAFQSFDNYDDKNKENINPNLKSIQNSAPLKNTIFPKKSQNSANSVYSQQISQVQLKQK